MRAFLVVMMTLRTSTRRVVHETGAHGHPGTHMYLAANNPLGEL